MKVLNLLLLLIFAPTVVAEDAIATYLANEGVLITHGEAAIAFDPVFNNTYGRYELVPESMVEALFEGDAPFTDLDAVFISHYHGDHFSAVDISTLLKKRPELKLYAPEQAVKAMHSMSFIEDIRDRIVSISLEVGDQPLHFQESGFDIGVSRIPHSGWPERMTNIENLAFRVTLGSSATVLHLGDADTKDHHYEPHSAYWAERSIDLAMPPYWYFSSKNGQYVLENRLKPTTAVGIHVPESISDNPDERPEELKGRKLFTRPGEKLVFSHSHPD